MHPTKVHSSRKLVVFEDCPDAEYLPGMNDLRNRAQHFAADPAGSVAISFAVGLTALVTVVFAAINFGTLVTVRSKMQAAADTAALSLASSFVTSGTKQAAQNYFDSSYQSDTLASPVLDVVYDNAANTWQVTASGSVDNALANLFGVSKIAVTSVATAQPGKKLTDLTFTPGSAKGWFDKTVTLYATSGGDPTPKALWSMNYTYDPATGGKSIVMSDSKAIDIVNADHIYLQMDIDPNSYGFAGNGTYQSNRTDGTDYINYIRQDGVVLSGPLDLFNAAGCGVSKTYNWEDGGDFDYLDFWFTATGGCTTTTAAVGARLIK